MILKFGKFKGQEFSKTPVWYQQWLNNQDWFNLKPVAESALLKAQRQFDSASKKLGRWNGYSRRGEAIYDAMFEAEKAMDDAIFNNPNPCSAFYDGSY